MKVNSWGRWSESEQYDSQWFIHRTTPSGLLGIPNFYGQLWVGVKPHRQLSTSHVRSRCAIIIPVGDRTTSSAQIASTDYAMKFQPFLPTRQEQSAAERHCLFVWSPEDLRVSERVQKVYWEGLHAAANARACSVVKGRTWSCKGIEQCSYYLSFGLLPLTTGWWTMKTHGHGGRSISDVHADQIVSFSHGKLFAYVTGKQRVGVMRAGHSSILH